jgi:hypothetical protein
VPAELSVFVPAAVASTTSVVAGGGNGTKMTPVKTAAGTAYVITGVVPGTGAAVTVTTTAWQATVTVLPAARADRVWRGHFAGEERVVLSDEDVQFVLLEEGAMRLRANTSAEGAAAAAPPTTARSIWVFPPLAGGLKPAGAGSAPLAHAADGLFQVGTWSPFSTTAI